MGCENSKGLDSFEYQSLSNKNYKTKYEEIIIKLKNLKSCERNPNKVKEIEAIIKSLQNEDIYTINEVDEKNQDLSEKSNEMEGIISEYTGMNKSQTFYKNLLSNQNQRKSEKYNGFLNKFKRSLSTVILSSHQNYIKQQLTLPDQDILNKELLKLNGFDFNIFKIDSILNKNTLPVVSFNVMSKYQFFNNLIPQEKFQSFITEIAYGYDRKIAYHNDLHGTDVFQTVFLFLEKGELIMKLQLSSLDVMSTLIASICHDYKHNGYNNAFHVNSGSELALTYNDQSVLENFHISETFKTLVKKENNILENLKIEEYKIFRRRLIEGILATDMAQHTKHLVSFNSKMESYNILKGQNLEKLITDDLTKNFENQQSVLSMCIHTADLSNPTKIPEVYEKWTELIFLEFFNQGDVEKSKKLPISLLCDRDTTNIPKSQIGFINFVVLPQYLAMWNVIPVIQPYLEALNINLKKNEEKVK